MTSWVSVACFGEVAEKLCATAKKGMKIYAEGSLKLGEWTDRAGEKRVGLQLAAWRAQVVGAGALGKNDRASQWRHAMTMSAPQLLIEQNAHAWAHRRFPTAPHIAGPRAMQRAQGGDGRARAWCDRQHRRCAQRAPWMRQERRRRRGAHYPGSKSLLCLARTGAAAIGHLRSGRRGNVESAGTRLQITREKKQVLDNNHRGDRP
jgi:hypothetical protein